MALVSRLLTSQSCSRQVILLRTRCNSLASRFLPARSGKNNVAVTCSWRFLSSTTALRNAGLKTAETATKVAKPKIKSEEVRRLAGLAKPEKYRLAGIN